MDSSLGYLRPNYKVTKSQIQETKQNVSKNNTKFLIFEFLLTNRYYTYTQTHNVFIKVSTTTSEKNSSFELLRKFTHLVPRPNS